MLPQITPKSIKKRHQSIQQKSAAGQKSRKHPYANKRWANDLQKDKIDHRTEILDFRPITKSYKSITIN